MVSGDFRSFQSTAKHNTATHASVKDVTHILSVTPHKNSILSHFCDKETKAQREQVSCLRVTASVQSGHADPSWPVIAHTVRNTEKQNKC